jgi:prefoldin subunit 5
MRKHIATKIAGVLRVLTSLAWIGIAVGAMIYGSKGIAFIQGFLDDNLDTTVENLEIVKTLILEAVDILETVEDSLDAVRDMIIDVGFTLADTRPLLDDTSTVITQDVPEALDGVQEAMPSVIEAASAVDETLIFLNAFKYVIPNPLGQDFEIGLGIDYAPTVPLDQALTDLSGNLQGLPESLRELEDDLATTSVNLITVRDELSDLTDELYLMNQEVADLAPQVEALAESVGDIQTGIKAAKESYPGTLDMVRKGYLAFWWLLVASQVATGYVGVLMVVEGGDDGEVEVEEEVEE